MSMTCEGGTSKKPKLILEGNKVITKRDFVFDGSVSLSYLREEILTFNTEEQAKKYYYKKK